MFEMPQKVLFKHCDPAGIVFYPRYFEMMNDCVEAWFADRLEWPFEEIHYSGGVPTANIATRFAAPSFHGDQLTLGLRVLKLGTTSLTYEMTATCDGGLRFRTEATLVYVNTDGRPTPWPAPAKTKIEFEMKGQL
ncbi:acyl-CoA thioesterase [Tritonibacter horizontis]|uniref:1,4-dihydroxy-2-naphthoyl-CoA hydrolase n=1 Tax=Tritonibacter horizontis TaxID=1768241 RepID=A0A132C091_9RHOB|nr:thioesterase family protein [Tritonibacter horizontis]KUP94001.1 1,4-dihydroxy-2-naphthoyl-CoA hydrolase [Tritonibacter horizontis]